MEDYTASDLFALNLPEISQYCPLSTQKTLRLLNSRTSNIITSHLTNTIRIQNYSFSSPQNIEDQLIRYEFQKESVRKIVIRGEYNELDLIRILNRFKTIEVLELENFKLLNNQRICYGEEISNNWLLTILNLNYLKSLSLDIKELPQNPSNLGNIKYFKALKLEELEVKNWPLDNIQPLINLISLQFININLLKLKLNSTQLDCILQLLNFNSEQQYPLPISSSLSKLLNNLHCVTELDFVVNSGQKPDYNELFNIFPNLINFKVAGYSINGSLFHFLPQSLLHLEFNSIEFSIGSFIYFIKTNPQLESLIIKQGQFITVDILACILDNLINLKNLEIYNIPLNMGVINDLLTNIPTKLHKIKFNFRIFQSVETRIELWNWTCLSTLRYLTLNNLTIKEDDSKSLREFNRIQVEINGKKLILQ